VNALWYIPSDRLSMLNCKTMSFDAERNTERPNTYWIFDHGTKHAQWTDVLNLKVRQASFLKL